MLREPAHKILLEFIFTSGLNLYLSSENIGICIQTTAEYYIILYTY